MKLKFYLFFTIITLLISTLSAIPNTFLLGTNKGLSAFLGNTEKQLWSEGEVKQIYHTETNFVFLTTQGILVSNDLETFTKKNEGLPFKTVKKYSEGVKTFSYEIQDLKDLSINPENPQIMVTATKDAVFLTRNGGDSWESLGLSDNTAGVKAVAVANLPELTVFMSHPITGVYYCNPDVNAKKWYSLSSGLKTMKTNKNADEVSDIIAIKNDEGKIELYASQTFFPNIYKLSISEKFSSSQWQPIWNGTKYLDTVESLCKTNNGLAFISYSTPNKINELKLKDTTQEPIQLEKSEEWINQISKTEFVPECMWIPKSEKNNTPSYSFSELWLLDMTKKTSPYAEIANKKNGIYLPTHQINYPEKYTEHKNTLEKNKLNMVVIDMKDDYGNLRFKTDNPLLLEKGRIRTTIDIDKVVPELKEKGIYLVARIVVFKDSSLANYKNNKYAIWDNKENKPWKGYYLKKQEIKETETTSTTNSSTTSSSNTTLDTKPSAIEETKTPAPKKYEYVRSYYDEGWVDPYCEEVWEYNVTIAQELINKGFDEIQFDYIRFPTDGSNLENAKYRWKDTGMDKESALMSFLSYARERIKAPISIDIYGANGWYRTGARTGQDVELLAKYTDVVCPMFYPSHFEQGFLAYDPTIQRPYRIYYYGSYRNTIIARNKILVRPYAQAFYLNVYYDKKYYDNDYVQRQVFGIRDSVDTGYTYWNNSGRYDDLRPHPQPEEKATWIDIPVEQGE